MSDVINFTQYKTKNQKNNMPKGLEGKKSFEMLHRKMSPVEIKTMISKSTDNLHESKIREFADLILESFDIDALNGYVPIISIISAFGVKVYKQKLKPRELSAYISVNPDYYDVYGSVKIACVNEDDSMGHVRFALAHELAHYLFDYDEARELLYDNTYIKDSNKNLPDEKRANYFAANLLMPARAFVLKKNEFEEQTKSLPDMTVQLAEYFKVSPKSIIKRYREVGELLTLHE